MEERNRENNRGVEYIEHKGEIIGLCIRNYHKWDETKFLTSDDFFLQIGLLYYNEGQIVNPHAHHKVPRLIDITQEVLFCIYGRIVYTFYDQDDNWREIASYEISGGDLICLFGAGHGGKALEPTRLIEVKQGPFLGTKDKFFCPDIPEK
ncbi:MAG: hypothetical protein H8D45_01620 [Bacteroidetes bacterium]|nr:hypothetical protein [Bacteroidota bacterium]